MLPQNLTLHLDKCESFKVIYFELVQLQPENNDAHYVFNIAPFDFVSVNHIGAFKIGCNKKKKKYTQTVTHNQIYESWDLKIESNLLPRIVCFHYRQISNVRCTKSPNLNVSRLVL